MATLPWPHDTPAQLAAAADENFIKPIAAAALAWH